jgi:hypothetical protein
MFRSSTILRELVQSLAEVTLLLRHCILCGVEAACRETACVLFVVQTNTSNNDTHIGTRYVILAKHWMWLPDDGFT